MKAFTRNMFVILILATTGCGLSTKNVPVSQPHFNKSTTPVAQVRPSKNKPVNPSTDSKVEKPSHSSDVKSDPSSTTKKAKPRRTLDELLLFYPSKYPKGNWKPNNLKFENAWFTAADKTRIHGWYCPHKSPRAAVLYAHGNGGNLSHRSHLLAYLTGKLQVSVLIFDYRGYGRSDGVPTVDGILQDARAARKYLAKRAGVKETDIVLMGRSLGGAVVTQLAAETPPRGLILESTFSSLKDMASHHYPYLSWLVPADRLNSAAQITKYKGPLLQSHGSADRTIPYASGKKLFQAANGPKQFGTVPNGDHNDPQPPEYYQELDRFIASLPKD